MEITSEMLEYAEKCANIRNIIDPKFKISLPLSNGMMREYSGIELIRIGEAMAALAAAIKSGDDGEIMRAIRKLNAFDSDA